MKGNNLVEGEGLSKDKIMESALYGINAPVVFLSENSLVRYAHSFVFWYVNNSCVNTVRAHLPWGNLYFLKKTECLNSSEKSDICSHICLSGNAETATGRGYSWRRQSVYKLLRKVTSAVTSVCREMLKLQWVEAILEEDSVHKALRYVTLKVKSHLPFVESKS